MSSLPSPTLPCYASLADGLLTLDNGAIRQTIRVTDSGPGFVANSLRLPSSEEEFLAEGSEEFSFLLNDRLHSGANAWHLHSFTPLSGEHSGSGCAVVLGNLDGSLQLRISYLLYPDLPLVRKRIRFSNTSGNAQCLEALDTACLRFARTGAGTECWVMRDYGRRRSLAQYIGDCYDPVLVVHAADRRRGIVLGNEAPGVLKRCSAFLKPDQLTVGLTHPDQTFGFRKWIEPGASWESPWVFYGAYAGSDHPADILNGAVADFVRRHLGTQLGRLARKPVFVYNTWEPFQHRIDEATVCALADAARDCGIEEFVIDDGWQASYGDWDVNLGKFPRSLKPVFDHIKACGMKPGLWISLAAAEAVSDVFNHHPEWLVRKADGSPISLHADNDRMYDWETYSMCMTTGWKDHIKGVILGLVREYGLEYIKGDFAAVTGAYTTDKSRSGCHAKGHSHRDRNESLLEMYEATWRLFDELHAQAPGLFIDCTFETMGSLHLIDLALCKHAEGNWLSNFCEPAPLGALRVRQLAWSRSPVIPATAMVIGNQRLEDPGFELSLMSLAGSLPIVLGDLRLLTPERKAHIRQWADWLKACQERHDFMSFRQDLAGFGEPEEGFWDGFQRINTETHSGGILGIFRHGAAEQQRTVTVGRLARDTRYEVLSAPGGSPILSATGRELSEIGFTVKLDKLHDGALFEVRKA